ncbi:MAG: DUF1559 domain-containing protein [Phycisphaerales bacterium JB059]
MSRPAYLRAFSLIVLLVVIAIIAVLIGVLLPALGSARASARNLICASRMRQVALGWQIYAVDNKDISAPAQPGRYPDDSRNVYSLGNGDQYRPRWFAVIGAAAGFDAYARPSPDPADEHSIQVDGSEVFLCPNAPDWTSTRNYAYGYNHHFLGNTRFVNNNPDDGFINFPIRASSLHTAMTLLAADSLGTAAGKPEADRTPNRPDGARHPNLTAEGGHGYALDPPRLVDGADYADRRNRAPQHRSAPHARHTGKTNASFCDGHVESMTLDQLGYQSAPTGAILADHENASNQFFSGRSTDDDPPLVFP